MHQLQRSWVRSQHPSAQWNLRGGRWSTVEYSTNFRYCLFALYADQPLTETILCRRNKTVNKGILSCLTSADQPLIETTAQARSVKKCMTAHEDCLSYSVLRREAAASLDPEDPDYKLYTSLKRVSKYFYIFYFAIRYLFLVIRNWNVSCCMFCIHENGDCWAEDFVFRSNISVLFSLLFILVCHHVCLCLCNLLVIFLMRYKMLPIRIPYTVKKR